MKPYPLVGILLLIVLITITAGCNQPPAPLPQENILFNISAVERDLDR